MNLGELVEKLAIANIKLFQLCDKKADAAKNPANYTKQELVDLCANDIALCKERARLKNAINKVAGVDIAEEIKGYGD